MEKWLVSSWLKRECITWGDRQQFNCGIAQVSLVVRICRRHFSIIERNSFPFLQ